jgi:hypothetical protein
MSIRALIKETTLKSGVVLSFWKVVGVNYAETDKVARVYLAGFVSQTLHDNGAEPAIVQAVELTEDLVQQIHLTREMPTKGMLYSLLSTTPLYKDAIPVMAPATPPAVPAPAAPAAPAGK